MSVEKIVRGFIDHVRSGKNPELAAQYLAPVVIAHQIVSGVSEAIERTPENYRLHVEEFLEAYGDYELFVEEFLAQGEKVYVRWRQEGRHVGNILGYEPTGLTLSTVGSGVYRVSGKKLLNTGFSRKIRVCVISSNYILDNSANKRLKRDSVPLSTVIVVIAAEFNGSMLPAPWWA